MNSNRNICFKWLHVGLGLREHTGWQWTHWHRHGWTLRWMIDMDMRRSASHRRGRSCGQAVMRWNTYDAKRKCSYKGKDDIHGEMVTFGSRSYLRVYDKRREAEGKGETVEGLWVRWELELKKD